MRLPSSVTPWLYLTPAGALLIPFFLIPIAFTVRNSVGIDDPYGNLMPGFSVANYVRVLSDPYYLSVFANTLLAALGTCLLALVVSYPFAWVMALASGTTRAFLLWAVYMPIYVSVIMRVFGWMVFIADSGLINQLIVKLGLVGTPLHMMNERTGLGVGLVHRYLPLMILPLVTSLQKVDESILRASANLGASRWFAWRKLILPISLPGAVAGAQLVFAGVLSDYVIPTLMGSTRFQLLAPAIYYEATTNAAWGLSGALASVVLVGVTVFLLAANLIVRRVAPWSSL